MGGVVGEGQEGRGYRKASAIILLSREGRG